MKDDFKENGHGKGHGKSWNFKSSREYEPCHCFAAQCILDSFFKIINEISLQPMLITPLLCFLLVCNSGPHRMRKKLCRNDMFYLNYPYDPKLARVVSKVCAAVEAGFNTT